MAVPAHDERDFAFAKRYKLGINISILPILPLEEQQEFIEHSDQTTEILTYVLKNGTNDLLASIKQLTKYWQEDGILVNSSEFN